MNRKRSEYETYEEYKDNLKKEEKKLKQKLKGEVIWNPNQGTYIRKEHGAIGNE